MIRELTGHGCKLIRRGSKHDVYENPQNGARTPIPRHKEIKESLCDLIIKQLGIIIE
ncbi:MAG: type II toxin-antitoxin system HicA family toxin [Nitrospirae bacterium]|nr:type II toxin-antitoxin system HicA family toxin [Nitrospirota bacterium]